MTTTWFLCPYDIIMDPTLMRVCSMARYIPHIPNKEGNIWDEIQVRGNYAVVKISATDKILDEIRTDADFTEIPKGFVTPEVITAFESLGYVADELSAKTSDDLLKFVTRFKSTITLNETKDDIVIGLPMANTKTVSVTDSKVPD